MAVLDPSVNPRPWKPSRSKTPEGVNAAAPPVVTTDQPSYPDKLDAGLLRIAGVCVLAVVMAILDTTVVGVAQRTFVAEFESTQAVVAWTMAGYTLALATVIPLAGWGADRFGTKRLFMGSVLAFTVGSLLCATAPNIALLIAFRVVHDAAGLYNFDPRGRPEAGWLPAGSAGHPDDAFAGRWTDFGRLAHRSLQLGMDLPHQSADRRRGVPPGGDRLPTGSRDADGEVRLHRHAAAVTRTGDVAVRGSSIPARGSVVDNHVWIPAAVGLVLITGFVLHALYRSDHPLIDLRLFRNREVTAANTTMLLCAAALFGAVLLIPSCFQELLHETPLQSGVHMIPERVGAMLTLPIAGVLMDKRGPD